MLNRLDDIIECSGRYGFEIAGAYCFDKIDRFDARTFVLMELKSI